MPSAPIRVTMIYHTSRECELPCPPTGCVCGGAHSHCHDSCGLFGKDNPNCTQCAHPERGVPRIRNIVFRATATLQQLTCYLAPVALSLTSHVLRLCGLKLLLTLESIVVYTAISTSPSKPLTLSTSFVGGLSFDFRLPTGDIVAETTQPYPSAIRATTGPLTAGIFIGLPQSPIDGLVLENVTVLEANPVDNPYRMVGWNCAQPRSIGHCTQRADTCFCFLN